MSTSDSDANSNSGIVEFNLSDETKASNLINRMYRQQDSIYVELYNDKKITFFISVKTGDLQNASKHFRKKASEELPQYGFPVEDIRDICRSITSEIINNIDKCRDLEAQPKSGKRKKRFSVGKDGDFSKLNREQVLALRSTKYSVTSNKVIINKQDENNPLFEKLEHINDLSEVERDAVYQEFDNMRFKQQNQIVYESVVFRSNNNNNNNNNSGSNISTDDLTTDIADADLDKNKNSVGENIQTNYEDKYISQFVYYDEILDEFKAVDYIIKNNVVIFPANLNGSPTIPYEFFSLDHLNVFYSQHIKDKVTVSTLFEYCLAIYRHFNKQPKHVCVARASAIVVSYLIDRYSITAYFGIIGQPGTGKTTDLHTDKWLVYRGVSLTNPNAAQLTRIFTTQDPGQCTLIVDEADKIDIDGDFMALLKDGYQYSASIQKVNTDTQKMDYFYTYGMKFWGSEKEPDSWKTMRFYDRTFMTRTRKQHMDSRDPNVKEISNDVGLTEQNREIKLRILNTRRSLLLYRMLHYNKLLPNIDIGVGGRDKELVYPFMQIFYGTEYQNYVVSAFQTLLDDMTNKKQNTLTTALCLEISKYLYNNKTNELHVQDFWKYLCDNTKFGEYMQDATGKKKWIETADHGNVNIKNIGIEFRNNIKAKSRHTMRGTLWTVDIDALIARLEALSPSRSKIKISQLKHDTGNDAYDRYDTFLKDPTNNYLSKPDRFDDTTGISSETLDEKLVKLWVTVQKIEDTEPSTKENTKSNLASQVERGKEGSIV